MRMRTVVAVLLSLLPLLSLSAIAQSTGGQESQSAPTARILVKLRPALSAGIEEVLPEKMALSLGEAATPDVRAFMNRYSVRTLRPLYPEMVRRKKEQQVSAIQMVQQVRQQFSGRASRFREVFQPPDVSRTYGMELAASQEEISGILALLKLDPSVEYAEEDRRVSISYTPQRSLFQQFAYMGAVVR